jgi:hypothetical protein
MGLLLSGSIFTACENSGETYGANHKIKVINKAENEFIKQFSFEVNSRHWRRLSFVNRFVQVQMPAITNEIINKGLVIIYLNESGKNVALPFTYYQMRRAVAFEPAYQKDSVCINISGNFILNPNVSFCFDVFVVSAKGLTCFKRTNWYKYKEI